MKAIKIITKTITIMAMIVTGIFILGYLAGLILFIALVCAGISGMLEGLEPKGTPKMRNAHIYEVRHHHHYRR